MPFWSKKGSEVAPIVRTTLLEKLLALNNASNQFEITRGTESDLLITQRIVDAKWKEGELGMDEKALRKGYKAWMTLSENDHEARFCEEITTETSEKKGPFGLGGMSGEKSTFRGKMSGTNHSSSGSVSIFGAKKNCDYTIDTRKVHDPIKKTLEENGWKFKLVATKGAATYN